MLRAHDADAASSSCIDKTLYKELDEEFLRVLEDAGVDMEAIEVCCWWKRTAT